MSAPVAVASPSFADFPSAARGVLDFLRARLGFDLWMVTRTEGDDWIMLDVRGTGYAVSPGAVFNWADSFCSRMVEGRGPRVAADVPRCPEYADAPIARLVPIGAYVGVPIPGPDGGLFGTLCAIHPTPRPAEVAAEQSLVELCAAMLAGLLAADLKTTEAARRAERSAAEGMRDPRTKLYTRRAWDEILTAEEGRCRKFGHPAFVAAIALQKQDPDAVREAAKAVAGASRSTDVVALIGPGELAVLGVESDRRGAEFFEKQVRSALAAFDTPADVAVVPRSPSGGGLWVAWAAAQNQLTDRVDAEIDVATPPPRRR